jgi:hypothetical protein
MRVKALKPHQNACGTKVGKDVGDEYDCSDRTGQQLAALGIVEIVGAVAAGADGDSALSAKNKAELRSRSATTRSRPARRSPSSESRPRPRSAAVRTTRRVGR